MNTEEYNEDEYLSQQEYLNNIPMDESINTFKELADFVIPNLIKKLNKKDRQVVYLWNKGMIEQEIANQLGISQQNVNRRKKRITRAAKKLSRFFYNINEI